MCFFMRFLLCGGTRCVVDLACGRIALANRTKTHCTKKLLAKLSVEEKGYLNCLPSGNFL
jgi:hypothetical protein